MMRMLFLVLCVFSVLGSQALWAVEIYANGHEYGSLQAYLASKKNIAGTGSRPVRKKLSDTALHKLYVLSVEHGVADALRDFYETRGESDFQITDRQWSDSPTMPRTMPSSVEALQEAIARAITRSKDPKLLVSAPGKVRVMALKAQDSPHE